MGLVDQLNFIPVPNRAAHFAYFIVCGVQLSCTILFTPKGRINPIITKRICQILENPLPMEFCPPTTRTRTARGDLEFGELKAHQGPRASTSGVHPTLSRHYTAAEEQTVIRKLDRTVVLFAFLLCLASLSDLTSTCSILSNLKQLLTCKDLGHAKIARSDLDLDLGYDGMEMAIVSFYIAYICSQWIGIAWNFVPAHIFVGMMAISQGTAMASGNLLLSLKRNFCTCEAHRDLSQQQSTQFCLSTSSLFYKREELGGRIGILSAATPLSTSVASLLSLAITGVGQTLSIASWRLLFLLEGIPSVLLGFWGWSRLPDRPDGAPFLTKSSSSKLHSGESLEQDCQKRTAWEIYG